MRSYKAARRAASAAAGAGLDPIPFEVTYLDTDGIEKTDRFELRGEVSAATLTDMAYFADLGIETPEGAAIMRRVFMEGFGDEVEFRRFWRIAPHLDDDTLVAVMGDVIEDTTGRPTTRPSESPAQSSTTGQGSRVVTLPGGFQVQAPAPQDHLPAASSR